MDKDAFEAKLREAIEKTSREIEEVERMTAPVSPDNAIGRVSRMDAINNKSVAEASLRNLEQKLEGLRAALRNIGQVDFGLCAKCGNPIPVGRLLLMPHSRFCVNCAR
jgi:DnaK suppressor protein